MFLPKHDRIEFGDSRLSPSFPTQTFADVQSLEYFLMY